MTYCADMFRASPAPIPQLLHADDAMGADMDAMLASSLPRPAFEDEAYTPSAPKLIIMAAAAGLIAALAAFYLPGLTDHLLMIQAQAGGV